MIRIENLTKRFGRTAAVDQVSLAVAPGESVALWGTNGAGKTTILRCVLGLLAYRGRISVGGCDVRRRGKLARRLIGYVPQELGFNDDFRVKEAVAFFARLKKVPVESTDRVLGRVGLQGQHRKRLRELSGGMKQRLALAIALLGDPPVLVLDEVTASLDACGRDEMVGLLAGLRGAGRSMLFASHRVEEVNALSDRVVMLEKGRVAGERPTNAQHPDPATVLHLHIERSVLDRAIDLLRRGGFAPSRNGVGLFVPVVQTQKAAPFRILADGRIDVQDFDFAPPQPPAETAP